MSLRTRLLLALLALALLPTLVFTLFTLDQLDRSIARWHRPGVERALDSGLEYGRGSLHRLETMVDAEARGFAAEWPKGKPDARQRAAMVARLERAGLDFVELYRRSDSSWVRVDQVLPRSVLVGAPRDLSSEVGGAIESGLLRSRAGALAGVAPLPDGAVLVCGIWVHPDFFVQVERLSQGAMYYRQLGVYVDLQRRLYWLLVAGMVIVVAAVAVWASLALAREMSKPIHDLAAGIERVAAGDLGARVEPEGTLELKSLGASFNTMAARLEVARSALQRAERESAWRDVARKLAHEFRNMLTPMRLSLQVLESETASDPGERRGAMQKSLTAALTEVEHLGRLADQFSQYARLPEPQLEKLDLVELVRAAAVMGGSQVTVIGNERVMVRCDRLLLSRALHNLVLNALEASPNGPVEIAVNSDRNEVVIEVRDRGPGIAAEIGERLFEPYVSTKKRGSGLGLSLVRDIVTQHGGTVTIENREGGGAVARVTLPWGAEA